MSKTLLEQEKNIANAVKSSFANATEPPKKEKVEERVSQMADIMAFTGDLRNIIDEVLVAIDTRMGMGVVLVDKKAKHDNEWVSKRPDIEWVYADAYSEYLREGGWSPRLNQSLSDVTMRILGHLQDPRSEGTSWNRRGLVIGHVQSGKTANYTGLIARAADAGYKFIIVIAGIHNNLRRQTQARIDAAFIGRSSDPENRHPIGVGLLSKDYPHPVTLTNVLNDFSKKTASSSGWKLDDFSKPIVLVIKKNVATLESLHKWLKDFNAKHDGRIGDVPMLMIDDEADNASVNTNKEDLKPTRTNAKIREILALFAKSCYVGYTATPFANIFINPEAYDKEAREDLFPRDFIYCLDAPTNYFGPEKVFLDDDSSQTIVRPIVDGEEFFPWGHKKNIDLSELPASLYTALNDFIVARAIRNLRGQANKHCSMMVNVSRFVAVQKTVRDLISLWKEKVQAAVQANYRMPESVSSKNEIMSGLHEVFNLEYAGHVDFTWEKVKKALNDVFSHLKVFVINSKSDEILDYAKYEEEGVGLTAIAIGGLSLSRGLTIEGLTISYMYRNTMMYDTLMQMGRWFGYRAGYEDLCRVYLAPDSGDWYAHIAEASQELTQQITRMRRDGLSPEEFGLYVRCHPDNHLLITARNKMYAGTEVTLEQSFSGYQIESRIVSTDPEVNHQNFQVIEEFWKQGFGGNIQEETSKGWIFKDVQTTVIGDFLRRFECHSLMSSIKSNVIDYLEKISTKYAHSDVLLISPGGEKELVPFRLNPQLRKVNRERLTGSAWKLSKGRVASRGDEQLGLSDSQINDAKREAKTEKNVSDLYYRNARMKPLLMIHNLEPRDTDLFRGPVAAFGVSFPPGDYSTTIQAVVNQVWVRQVTGHEDDPDDEEDYDV